jgi:hypothetical protein
MSATCATCNQPLPTKGDVFRFRLPRYGESFGVIGVTQHGKSTWAKDWAAWLIRKLYSVVAWDPADEWSVHGKARKHCKRGPLRDAVSFSELLKNPRRYLSRRRLQLAVRPDPYPLAGAWEKKRKLSPEEWVANQFTTFAQLVRRWTPAGPLALFIDECNLLFKHAAAALDDISERWAKEEIVPIFLGQRWTHFTVNMRAQIAWLISFKQVKKTDLRFLSDDAGQDFARALPWLPPGRYRVANLRQASTDALSQL